MTSDAASPMSTPISTEPANYHPELPTLPSAGAGLVTSELRLGPRIPPNILSDPNEYRFDTSVKGLAGPLTSSLRQTAQVNRPRASAVELLAEWNGCVTSVQTSGYSFSATLKGIVGEGIKGEEEDATIPIADVSEWDRDLLHPGNFFRLCVIHEVLPTGQPRRYTQVVFRRLPAYRQHDLDQAAERGRELARSLRVE